MDRMDNGAVLTVAPASWISICIGLISQWWQTIRSFDAKSNIPTLPDGTGW